MLHSKRTIIALAFVVSAIGFLGGFWPLAVAGILLAALAGRWVSAILLGLLLDIAYGSPVGPLHFLYFPLTLLAGVVALVRVLVAKRLRTSQTDTL